MNWTMVSVDLKDDLNKTTDTNMNKFTVRGGYCSYKSVKTEYYSLDCYNVLFPFFFSDPLLREGPFHYIVHLLLSSPYTC